MTQPEKHRKISRLVVCGALGRMGQRTAELAIKDERFSVVAGVVLQSAIIPRALFPLIPEREALDYFKRADVIIDFSAPAACVKYAHMAAKARKPIVIGATGLSTTQTSVLKACAKKIPVFFSPNFSRGMNILFHLAQRAAAVAADYDAAIFEIHHTQKQDSPSGSALKLAEAVRRGRSADPKPVPIASQRLGTIIGEHTVTFAGPFERIELTHRAQSRDVFARGALDAALWVQKRRPGFYHMQDMLGL